MKRYYVYLFLNLMVIHYFISYCVKSFIECDYLWFALCLSLVLNDFLSIYRRHLTFMKYYPYFNDKWDSFIL